jgi:phage gpG-like protein
MTLEISFREWAPFWAKRDKAAFKRWLKTVATESEKAFKKMGRYPPASTPGEYPAIRSGALRASIKTRVTDTFVEISSNTSYAGYLRHGTLKMKRRKMSDNALKEGMAAAKKRADKWVGWSHGTPGTRGIQGG